ncbi:MAG: hypothetical protein GX206_10555, partial [Clostridiales bacterium]|nr:hypothetical protein [Clostridiales bacterium]
MDFNNYNNNNDLNNEHKDYIAGENFYMFNPQVEENSGNTIEMTPVNNNYSEPKKVKVKRKNVAFRRAMSYVLVGLICATVGAGATLGSTLYLLPKMDFFENTPLYEAVSQNASKTTNTVNY